MNFSGRLAPEIWEIFGSQPACRVPKHRQDCGGFGDSCSLRRNRGAIASALIFNSIYYISGRHFASLRYYIFGIRAYIAALFVCSA